MEREETLGFGPTRESGIGWLGFGGWSFISCNKICTNVRAQKDSIQT